MLAFIYIHTIIAKSKYIHVTSMLELFFKYLLATQTFALLCFDSLLPIILVFRSAKEL